MNPLFLFPGQGSQYVGMGKDLLKNLPSGSKKIAMASEYLGEDVLALMLEGPEERLKNTEITQPLLFTLSAILTDMLKERGIEPALVAGHSLGEFSANYAAGTFDFEPGLKLVTERGKLMARSGSLRPGGMAAILGLDETTLKKICEECSGSNEPVVMANLNSPGQIVISGHRQALARAMALCQQKAAKRVVPLEVNGAFHSPLMEDVATSFKSVLEATIFRDPLCPVLCNVNGMPVDKADALKENLLTQLTAPVRWQSAMLKAKTLGSQVCIEVGPKKVLTMLLRQIDRSLKAYAFERPSDLDKILSVLEVKHES